MASSFGGVMAGVVPIGTAAAELTDAGSGWIDVHAHFIPEVYRTAAVAAGHAQPDGMPAIPAWTLESMLSTMDRIGTQTAFLSVSSPGVHFGDDAAACALARTVNEYGVALKNANSPRIGHFASLPLPDVTGALKEIAHAFEQLGSDGVIIESNSGGHYLGDERFDPVLAELDRRSAVVLLHPTSPHCPACSSDHARLPRPILEFMFETARAVTNLILSGALEKYPRIRFIIPHAGGTLPAVVDRVATAASVLPGMQRFTPSHILSLLGRLHYDLAGVPLPRLLPALRSFVPPTQLLYGSDWPFTPEPAVVRLKGALIEALQAEIGTLAAVSRSNAAALFPRLTNPAGRQE